MTKYILTALAPAALIAPIAQAASWGTDLPAALKQAAASGKNVLVVFTGSDWCPPCIALKKNVLSKADFAEYAKANFVLVELDFPRRKQLPAALRAANDKLAAQYKVTGFPTTLALSPDGKELARVVGGVANLDALKSQLPTAAASSAAGMDCSSGVCRPAAPASSDQKESDLERVKRELEALGDDEEAIYEYTTKELESEDEIDRHAELVLHLYQTMAIANTATEADELAALAKSLEEEIIPAFKEDFPEEIKLIEEIIEALNDPDQVEEILKENKK